MKLKTLKISVKDLTNEIKNHVPYAENKRMVAETIIELVKKTHPSFDEMEFLYDCGIILSQPY